MTVTSLLLVTGGTGTLGRLVVPRLREAGCEMRVLSRRSHESGDGIEFTIGDLATGEGLEAAVDGVGTIVHCAGGSKGDEDKARNLVRAASRVGAQHLVYISVVGVERIPVVSGVDRTMFGYFASKRAAEKVIADSGLPWTTLRATQFHDLMLMVARQTGEAAGDTGPGRLPIPAGRRRRGGGPTRRALPRQAIRPRARHRRAAGVRGGRAAPRVSASESPAPADPAGQAPRQGCPRNPGRCESGARTGGGPSNLGGLPDRAAALAHRPAGGDRLDHRCGLGATRRFWHRIKHTFRPSTGIELVFASSHPRC